MAKKEELKQQENANLRYYEMLRKVPDYALKAISGGRLSGMTDINPLFRIKAMTEAFGPCGIGWKYEITKQWQEVYGQEVKSFTNINLYIKVDGEWSDAIPGTGGATLVEVNSKGYAYVNDEGHKMSLTDALSVAMKSLGVAADVYYSKDKQGQFDTKYEQQSYVVQPQQQVQPQPTKQAEPTASVDNGILKEVSNAQDIESLLAIWNKYATLWQNAQFSGAVTARKDQILKNGKS